MKSNYKRLGNYIKESNIRNGELKASKLLGINIDKFFMPSVANIVGTDMSVYKIVKKGQFACNRMHVGRDYRLPIALSNLDEDFMVSPAYDVFEVIDPKELVPEYLMMWFSRKEFDRNAWFYTDADVRGGLPWKSFCDMQLPIPHPDKQRELVKEYNTIANRINLNNQLIEKLEETAQAIYKQWFVDFEFPDENGQPYKSNGGEMEWCEELSREIPKKWRSGCLRDVANQIMGYAFEGEQYSVQTGIRVLRGENVSEKFLRWDTEKKWPNKIDAKISKCQIQEFDLVIGMDGSKVGKNWSIISKYDLPLLLAQRVSCLRGIKAEYQLFIYLSMSVLGFEKYISQVFTGTSIPHISGQQIFDFPIILPAEKLIFNFDLLVSKTVNYSINITQINLKLKDLQQILLSKISTF